MNKLLFKFMSAFVLLITGFFVFSNKPLAETTCKYAASYKGQIYEVSFIIVSRAENGGGDGYKYDNFVFTIDKVEKEGGNDFALRWFNIPDDGTCPEVALYYEISGTGGGKYVLVGNTSDDVIKNIMNSNYTNVPMYDSTKPVNPTPNPPQKPDDFTNMVCKYASSDNKYSIDLIIFLNSSGKYFYHGIRRESSNNSVDPYTTVTEANQKREVYANGCPAAALYYTDSNNKYYMEFGSEKEISTKYNYNTYAKAYLKLTGKETYKPNSYYELDYSGSPCKNPTIKNAVKVVGKVISIIQIAVPIILIVMALVDIAKSIISMDDSKSKKSINHLIKRVISAVLVFFIIAIVRFVCGVVSSNSIDDNCMNLISDPWKK